MSIMLSPLIKLTLFQTITHALSYNYVRCMRTISIPGPIFYAHVSAHSNTGNCGIKTWNILTSVGKRDTSFYPFLPILCLYLVCLCFAVPSYLYDTRPSRTITSIVSFSTRQNERRSTWWLPLGWAATEASWTWRVPPSTSGSPDRSITIPTSTEWSSSESSPPLHDQSEKW